MEKYLIEKRKERHYTFLSIAQQRNCIILHLNSVYSLFYVSTCSVMVLKFVNKKIKKVGEIRPNKFSSRISVPLYYSFPFLIP